MPGRAWSRAPPPHRRRRPPPPSLRGGKRGRLLYPFPAEPPGRPLIERFAKATNVRQQAEEAAHQHLTAGAVSSVITEEDDYFVLTTVLIGADTPPHAGEPGSGLTSARLTVHVKDRAAQILLRPVGGLEVPREATPGEVVTLPAGAWDVMVRLGTETIGATRVLLAAGESRRCRRSRKSRRPQRR